MGTFVTVIICLALVPSSKMSQVIPDGFGKMVQNQNSNLAATGEGNQGTVESNNNICLTARNCILNLFRNNNLKLSCTSSKIDIQSSSNTVVEGDKNDLVISRNHNLKYNGDGNKATLSSNNNLKHDCSFSTTNLEGNNNVKVSGSKNEIVAKDNQNLKIFGDENKIHVEGTENHAISRGKNIFEVLNPVQESNSWMGFFGRTTSTSSRSKSLNYFVSYEGSARIEKDLYTLGIYKFRKHLPNDCLECVDIEMVEPRTSWDILQIEGNCPEQLRTTITEEKDGVRQQITFVGPSLSKIEVDNAPYLRIKLAPNSLL